MSLENDPASVSACAAKPGIVVMNSSRRRCCQRRSEAYLHQNRQSYPYPYLHQNRQLEKIKRFRCRFLMQNKIIDLRLCARLDRCSRRERRSRAWAGPPPLLLDGPIRERVNWWYDAGAVAG